MTTTLTALSKRRGDICVSGLTRRLFFGHLSTPAPWLSWLKRLSSKQEIGSLNLPGGFINLTPFELMIYIIDKYLILLKRKKLADQDVGSR